MLGMLVAVFGLFAVIVLGSLQISDFSLRRVVVGLISVASLISMFASPLFVIVSLFKAYPVDFYTDDTLFFFFPNLKIASSFNRCFVYLIIIYFFQNLVIRTKSVEFMPFYLSLSTFLMSISFFLYGIFNDDAFLYVSSLQHKNVHVLFSRAL